MIPVVRLVKSMRYVLQDMQGISISDHELIEAINHAASLLYSRIGEKFVSASLKSLEITIPSTNEYQLPLDFVRVHQVIDPNGEVAIPTTGRAVVMGSYRMIGSTLYAPAGNYKLEYYYIPLRVTSLGDDLDAPLSMSPYLEQIALAVHAHDLGQAEQIAMICAQTLGGREISHIDGQGPVQVLGGKV